ncbi:MAG TPA: type III-B CRISPR module RAMP protein Cmr6 [Flavilitoribacter sp.]|nr:type III-B CRISPR module RAMP protein Cmr6 [Flavilitoribacter sp.]
MSINRNLGLAFYRLYYQRNDFINPGGKEEQDRRFGNRNKSLLEAELPKLEDIPDNMASMPGVKALPLNTVYPGLVLGTGYVHGVGQLGEFKIGFYFDHTTGLPTIPGSSIKGALRAAFPERYFEKEIRLRNKAVATPGEDAKKKLLDEADYCHEMGEGRLAYIDSLIKEIIDGKDKPAFSVRELEWEIFEGIYAKTGDAEFRIAVPERDLFLDATLKLDGNRPDKNLFLDKDFITPHNKPKNGIPAEMRNPIPIQFLKVLPGISFDFRFRLLDDFQIDNENTSRKNRKLNANQRLKLFKAILLDLGVGAKTNVGYGQFCDPDAPASDPRSCHYKPPREDNQNQNKGQGQREERRRKDDPPKTEKTKEQKPFDINDYPPKSLDQLKRTGHVLAKVTTVSENDVTVELHVTGWTAPLIVKYFPNPKPLTGQWVEVEIKQLEGKKPNWSRILLETNKIRIIENQQ